MKIGIILAGGKGTRFKAEGMNKTSVKLNGKPLVKYGTDLLKLVVDKVLVLVGPFAESVIEAVGEDPQIEFVYQSGKMGTGAAAADVINYIGKQGWQVDKVWVGNGDHMMFYTPEIASDLGKKLDLTGVALAMVTFDYADENRFGRIVRKPDGLVDKIVEYKDASEEIRNIKEVNAGFYCFKYDFLVEAIKQLVPSPVSGEYYLTDLVEMAVKQGLGVVAVKVPFENVGVGVNTREELAENEKLITKK